MLQATKASDGAINGIITMNRRSRLTMRRGDMSPAAVLALVSVVAVVALAYLTLMLRPDARRSNSDSTEIRVYCASGVAEPIELAHAELSGAV